MIHGELCKKFKFDYTNKLNVQNPESFPEKEMQKPHRDFDIKTTTLILVRRQEQQKKRTYRSCWQQGKTEGKLKER